MGRAQAKRVSRAFRSHVGSARAGIRMLLWHDAGCLFFFFFKSNYGIF